MPIQKKPSKLPFKAFHSSNSHPTGGAPPSIHLDSLTSWTHPDDPSAVKEIAEVSVNGKPLGILWKPPFRTDITTALQPGHNHIKIRITNGWPNRMIGDLQPGARHYTFAVI